MRETFTLPAQEIQLAMQKEFDLCEKNVLQYLSGYFLKKLLDSHKRTDLSTCPICSQNQDSLLPTSSPNKDSETFLHFKKFCHSSQLHKCCDKFVNFVKVIIQICMHMIENYFFVEGIGKSIVTSALAYLDSKSIPIICSPKVKEELMFLVTRTVLFYQIKWLNHKLKQSKWKHESMSRKLTIIQHK